ncbi:hypothetical protein BGP_4727 [Beggiatoa sp. PS]|nr:hypothetical protein BGP_4727 [Beggiatoa sp. PS]
MAETPVEEIPIGEDEEPGSTTTVNTTTDSPKGNNLISFTEQGYISYKNDGTATITVNRNGTQGIVSIDYTTINGTAIAGQDYQSTSGTFTWDIGEEGNQSFDVALLDTATLGHSLILSLGNLSDAEGQFGRDIAVLTILDEIVPSNLPTTAEDEQTPSTIADSTTTGGETTTQPTTNETETTEVAETTEAETTSTAESTSGTIGTGTVNDPTVVVPTDVLASDVIVDGGKIDEIFNAQGQIFYEDIIVTNRGSVSDAIFDAGVENDGLIANSTFTENAFLNGGTLSGDIKNEGLIQNVNFVGMSLTGGTLSGDVTNNSQIGGIIQDVQLSPGATLTGGKIGGTIKSAPDSTLSDVQLTAGTRVSGGTLAGKISGDPNNPPIITAANIAPGTVLSNVRISPTVDLPADVVLGPGVILPSEPPILADFGYDIADIATLDAENFAQLEPAVFGTFGSEEMEEIPPESFNNTSSEQVAEMNEEGTAAMTAEQFNAMPAEAMGGMTEENMGSVSQEVMAEMREEHIEEMEAEAFGGMEQEQLAAIPPETMKVMAPAQMAELPKETLGSLSTEQFEQLPAQALSGLKSDNMGGLSNDVLNNFTPEHLAALDAGEFTQMPSEDVSKLFTNFDANKISIQNAAQLVPPGWQIDTQSGEITAPEGAKLTPRTLPASDNVPSAVTLPQIADIGQGMGLGGQGTSVKDNMTLSLEEQDLSDFVLSQNEETGILWVEGTGDSEGIKYTFIPDIDNVIQVDGDKIPIGLAVMEGGFYTITTPDQKQYKVVPAPQDPIALSEVLEGGKVVIGKRGDVMMDIPTDTRKRGKPRQVAMFDPFIEPAPDDLCVEIAPGEIVCDFENAPPSQQPGLHLEVNTRAAYKNQQQGKVIFPDGTAQVITPTLLTPDVFAELGFEFEGVEDIVFNANGIFYVLYQGQPYLIVPKFEVVTEEVTEEEIAAENDEQAGESSIVVNSDATLTYTIVIEAEEQSNTRKRGEPRQVMQFQPEIQVAPDDLCVEIIPGEIVCDFENVSN